MSLQWKTLATLTDAFFENTAADPAILLYCSLPLCVFKKRLSILRIDIPALRCGSMMHTLLICLILTRSEISDRSAVSGNWRNL